MAGAAGAGAMSGGGGVGTTAGAGGQGGVAGAAGSAGAVFWTDPYNATGGPTDFPTGYDDPGTACMSCHGGAGGTPGFVFAGTAYAPGSGNAAPDPTVEIGVLADGVFYSAYSATNGNFWFPGTVPIADWSTAEIRIRNASGELSMGDLTAQLPNADCNSNGCHSTNATRIREPAP
jgi:hypothetical protein